MSEEPKTIAQLLRIYHRETGLKSNARFDSATDAERSREGSGFFGKALPGTRFWCCGRSGVRRTGKPWLKKKNAANQNGCPTAVVRQRTLLRLVLCVLAR